MCVRVLRLRDLAGYALSPSDEGFDRQKGLTITMTPRKCDNRRPMSSASTTPQREILLITIILLKNINTERIGEFRTCKSTRLLQGKILRSELTAIRVLAMIASLTM